MKSATACTWTVLLAVGSLAAASQAEALTWSVDECHGCCALNDVSWFLAWITYARRASLVLMMLSGFVLYYIPESRAPARKVYHSTIDLVSNALKSIVGKVSTDESFVKNTKNSGVIDFVKLKNQSNKQCLSKACRKHSRALLCSQRTNKQLNFPCENQKGKHKLPCEVHPRCPQCATKLKEKPPAEKVSVSPSALMQFDTQKRQIPDTSSDLRNDHCFLCKTSLNDGNKDNDGEKSVLSKSSLRSRMKAKCSYKHNATRLEFDKKLLDVPEIELTTWDACDFVGNGEENDQNSDKLIQCDDWKLKKSRSQSRLIDMNEEQVRFALLKKKPSQLSLRKFRPAKKAASHQFAQKIKPEKPKGECCCSSMNKERCANEQGGAYKESSDWTLTRAFQWVFGGCPSVKDTLIAGDKRLTAIVQSQLSNYF